MSPVVNAVVVGFLLAVLVAGLVVLVSRVSGDVLRHNDCRTGYAVEGC